MHRQIAKSIKPGRLQWSLRSMLVWMTAIGIPLALLRISPLISFCLLVFVGPPLVMVWVRRLFQWSEDSVRTGAKVWTCLLCFGLPLASLFTLAYSGIPPTTPFPVIGYFLYWFALPLTFIAIFHYFITISLCDAFDIAPRARQRFLPDKLSLPIVADVDHSADAAQRRSMLHLEK